MKPHAPGGARAPLAVTGWGMVTAAGRGHPALVEALQSARSHVMPLRHVDVTDLPIQRGAEVTLVPETPEEPRLLRLVRLALDDALESCPPLPLERTGVALGTTLGVIDVLVDGRGDELIAPGALARARERLDIGGSVRALALGAKLRGPTSVFSLACASGHCALEQAAADIALARADAMLVGGADTLGRFMQGGFCSLRGFGTGARDAETTLALGEGAVFVALEPLESARARRLPSPAVLLSQRLVSDGYHLASPDPSGKGMTRAVALAIDDAALTPSDIGAVVLTAMGSPVHERMLKDVLGKTLGKGADDLPVTSGELAVGHVLAASSILAIAYAASMIARRWIDAAFPLKDVGAATAQGSTALDRPNVLIVSVGFGGFNGVAVVGAPR